MKQKLVVVQGETDKPTTVVGDFNTSFSDNDRTNTQKVTKRMVELNDTSNLI